MYETHFWGVKSLLSRGSVAVLLSSAACTDESTNELPEKLCINSTKTRHFHTVRTFSTAGRQLLHSMSLIPPHPSYFSDPAH